MRRGGTDRTATVAFFATTQHERTSEATCARNGQVVADAGVRLYRPDGAKRVADDALVAITLMIAESAPDQREILTRIIVELINERN